MTDLSGDIDQGELASDAKFTDMLERVSFQPGILLGADALSAEQTYHLRRLTRHQRWLIGPGTVFGLRVDVMDPPPTDDTSDVRLTVAPGYAIDGLGREVLVGEAYAISLRDWLKVPDNADAVSGYLKPDGILYLKITVRSRAAPQGLQPVVSELFDAGLDPVVTSRVGDSFLLEIVGDDNDPSDAPADPLATWAPLNAGPGAGDAPGSLTPREEATLGAISDAGSKNALALQAWLLRQSLPPYDDSPGSDAGYLAASRLVLASLYVSLADLTTPPTVAGTAVNNLVRPFVRPNALLAALSLP